MAPKTRPPSKNSTPSSEPPRVEVVGHSKTEPKPSSAEIKPAQGKTPSGENSPGKVGAQTQSAPKGKLTNPKKIDYPEGFHERELKIAQEMDRVKTLREHAPDMLRVAAIFGGGRGRRKLPGVKPTTPKPTPAPAPAPKPTPAPAPKPTPAPAPTNSSQAQGSNGAYVKRRGKSKDPCKHPYDKKKKKKYVVYRTTEYDKNGKPIGTYVGRTSGKPDEAVTKILKRRQSGHHRNTGGLEMLFETDSYAAVRGAEQLYKNEYSTVKQDQPISPRNKRIDDYIDCATSKGVP